MLFVQDVYAMEEKDVNDLFTQMSSVMNRRNAKEVKRFFTYYSKPEARFLKESYLMNPTNIEQILEKESINMNAAEYADYINGIIQTPRKYGYSAIVQKIEMKPADNIAYVSVAIQDGAIVNKTDKDTLIDYKLSIVTASNCNFALKYENAHFYFLAMNCVEKINKIQEKIETSSTP